MARRQNVRDRIGMAVYEKKKLNKKLVTMQKSFQEVKHLIGDEKRKNKHKATAENFRCKRLNVVSDYFLMRNVFDFPQAASRFLLYISALYHQTQTAADVPEVIRHAFEADG